MAAGVSDLLPVFLMFLLGVVLRATKAVRRESGEVLLRIVFYATLPALMIVSISRTLISRDIVLLPGIAAITVFALYGLSRLVVRNDSRSQRALGVTLIGSLIMNVGFVYPFVMAIYGLEGVARAAIFDVGNGLVVLTFVYYLACRHGAAAQTAQRAAGKVLASPPLWALLVAAVMNGTGWRVPKPLHGFLETVGAMTMPLILLAVGLLFAPRFSQMRLLFVSLGIRVLGGLLCGLLLSELLGLEGMTRSVVILCTAAPVGYNTLTFSSLAELDTEFASNLVSVSILLGLIYTPILILLLG